MASLASFGAERTFGVEFQLSLLLLVGVELLFGVV